MDGGATVDGAQAQQVIDLLRTLVEAIDGPQFDYLMEQLPLLLEGIEMLQGVIMACCGALIGWLAGNELLRCLW